jgi:hypothetical protein
MDNNNVNIMSTDDVEKWINTLPDPLPSPPPLIRQIGYIGEVNRPDSISPPPVIRMNDDSEDELEVDLESFLKGLAKPNVSKTPTKHKPLTTFFPVTDFERNLKNIMKIFGNDINTNVKYYERIRREHGFLSEKDKEDIICVHNNLRKLAVEKINTLLENHTGGITQEAQHYLDGYFQTQLNRIRTLLNSNTTSFR